MKIAICGMATESCTFSPLHTTLGDFRIWRGDEMLELYPFLDQIDADFVPVFNARAMPGGSIEAEAYHRLKTEILTGLRAIGPVDGVYLHLHGAMNVVGMDDAEGDLAAAVRAVIGPNAVISASLDLHGNISAEFVAQVDMLTAFRTAPHIDYLETRERACRMLVRCLRDGTRPQIARVWIPVALPGEKTSTEWEPGASLYAFLPEIDRVDGVLDASLLVGYAWADEPVTGATAIVTGFDQTVIRREAARLAQRFWDVRQQFDFGVEADTIDACIRRALDAPEACVFISDSGDNPTAGGVGDVPVFLERLIALNVHDAAYAGITDSAAALACREAGIGAEVQVALGGKLDPVHGKPVPVTGQVTALYEGDPLVGVQAALDIGGIKVCVTERRKAFHYIADFQNLGIEPLAHKLVIVKIGYLVPDLKRAAPRALLALSPGAVNQAITSLPFRRIKRPMFPFDPDMIWTAPLE